MRTCARAKAKAYSGGRKSSLPVCRKIWTNWQAGRPAAARQDAEKLLAQIVKKYSRSLRLCRLETVEYAEDLKDPAQVTVKARTVIDQEAVAATVTQEVRCVLATTDTARQWSMAELWSTYHKQSAIERM